MDSNSFQDLLPCVRKLQQLGQKGHILSPVLQVSFTTFSLEAHLCSVKM